MEKIKEYKVVVGSGTSELNKLVMELIMEGWSLQGGASALHMQIHNGSQVTYVVQFLQSMVR